LVKLNITDGRYNINLVVFPSSNVARKRVPNLKPKAKCLRRKVKAFGIAPGACFVLKVGQGGDKIALEIFSIKKDFPLNEKSLIITGAWDENRTRTAIMTEGF
jgi:hypothetical protein